jgi:hypothetical protein
MNFASLTISIKTSQYAHKCSTHAMGIAKANDVEKFILKNIWGFPRLLERIMYLRE